MSNLLMPPSSPPPSDGFWKWLNKPIDDKTEPFVSVLGRLAIGVVVLVPVCLVVILACCYALSKFLPR